MLKKHSAPLGLAALALGAWLGITQADEDRKQAAISGRRAADDLIARILSTKPGLSA